jgi:ketosteroid isomerase-like protein
VAGNVEIVRRAYEAWNRGDLPTFAEFLAPDVEMDFSERVLNPGSYRGRDGFLRWTEELVLGPRQGSPGGRPRERPSFA